jgi:hypothetical protein
MPGLFLPSRLLDLLYKINPTEDMFIDIALLVRIETDKVKRYFKERNEEDLHMFRHEKIIVKNCKKSAKGQVYHRLD